MEHSNLEVRTRFQDVMLRFIKGNERIVRMRQASDGYIQLYKETGSVLYFVRAFEIRVVKSLYDDTFLKELRDVVIGSVIHPGWLTKVLNQVKINVSDGLDNPYVKTILSTYSMVHKGDAYWRDGYWDMLHEIEAIEDKEWHYQKALNWEAYADRMDENKKENVFNVNHHAILQESHKEIYLIKESFPEDYRRIRDKYNAAKKVFVEMLSQYGVRFKYQVPESVEKQIEKQMSELKLGSIVQVVITFLNLPFYPSWKLLEDIVEDVTKLNEQVQKEPTLIRVLQREKVSGDGRGEGIIIRIAIKDVTSYDKDEMTLIADAVDCRLLKVSYEQNISTKCADFTSVTLKKSGLPK